MFRIKFQRVDIPVQINALKKKTQGNPFTGMQCEKHYQVQSDL